MMYFGGKIKAGKHIADIINRLGGRSYHESFCGMLGVGRHVTIPKKSASDAHPDLIAFLQAIKDGWTPPTNVTPEEYYQLKWAAPSAARGFVGFACSFGGKFFGGYARNSKGRNYAQVGSRNAVKMTPWLQAFDLSLTEYHNSPLADIIYCDPPYKGTTDFSLGKFDSNLFWDWARETSQKTMLLVSEYTAPGDFTEIWRKNVTTDMKSLGGQKLKRVEKLFTYRNSF